MEKTLKENDIRYYCNSCGELHDGGEHTISAAELPPPLQALYATWWTEELSVDCYIVRFREQYGLCIEAIYEEDSSRELGWEGSSEEFLQIVEAYEKKLERLVRLVSKNAIIGVHTWDPEWPTILLFIPDGTPSDEIAKLYYLMDKYNDGFFDNGVPETVDWENIDLPEFLTAIGIQA